MNFIHCSGYDLMSNHASELVLRQITNKADSLLCTATGHSPLGLYQNLAAIAALDPAKFSHCRIIKLDEWLGLAPNDPATCEYFLKYHLVDPLGITKERYIGFQADTGDAQAECSRIQQCLNNQGPIDLCILGIGTNGHLALNEPAVRLQPYCHVAALTSKTQGHAMLSKTKTPITQGLTLGMSDILSSRSIILLISGQQKQEVTQHLLEERITTQLPASLLWLHPQVDVIINDDVFK